MTTLHPHLQRLHDVEEGGVVAVVPAEALRPAGGGVQAAEGGHLAPGAGAVTLVCGVESGT